MTVTAEQPGQAPFSKSDLCRSCGLCCDGTLFGRVRLQPQDNSEPLRLAGIVVVSEDSVGQFSLACAAHQHGCCQVYESRPENCRSYQCKLLRRFGKGVVSRAEAATLIDRMRRLRQQLGAEIERLRPGMARASAVEISKIVPSFAELSDDVELHKRWAPVVLRLVALRRMANEHFHARNKK